MFAVTVSELTKRFSVNAASLVLYLEPTTLFTERVGAVACSEMVCTNMSQVANISRTRLCYSLIGLRLNLACGICQLLMAWLDRWAGSVSARCSTIDERKFLLGAKKRHHEYSMGVG